MESGYYNLKFDIKIDKKIEKSKDCGFKMHNPVMTFNDFLDNLIVGENNHCEIKNLYINKNDLCIFIFDSCLDKINVEISNIIFEKNNYENLKDTYDICISINVHEKPEFLKRQLDNIEAFVDCKYCIILNCNNFMYEELKKINLKNNIFVNPNVIEKRRWHGSLLNGIVSNMEYSFRICEKYDFFLIMSSRNLFYNKLTLDKLIAKEYINSKFKHTDNIKWYHWKNFCKTQLFKYCVENNYFLSYFAHEGLCFDYSMCKNMINFLCENNNIKNDLFQFETCCEEFALQTISLMFTENKCFKYLGHGCNTQNVIPTDTRLFVYKTERK